MKQYILLTGATGFIGRYLLRHMLLQGLNVAVVARGSDNASASERINKIVAGFEKLEGKTLPKPICFSGNLQEELLGLDDFAVDWFADNCNSVFHNGASIRFHAPSPGDLTSDPYLSNLTGTYNMLELCKLSGIEEFHFVSTAYVSGKRTDRVLESELDVKQGFINDYQISKLEAEKAVHAAPFLKSKTIYRPGLVVGDSRTGFTTHPDFGLYHYIAFNAQIIAPLRAALAPDETLHIPFRLRFTGEERRNIVTVDWVSDIMMRILMNPEYHNETYHLTPEYPCSSAEIVKELATYFNYDGIQFVGYHDVPDDDRTELEKMFYDYVEQFEAYWEDEPTFDRTNTNRVSGDLVTPRVDSACLNRLIAFAVENCFSPKAAVPQTSNA